MSDLTGQMLGAYKVLERIGTGGMASVYRAYQASMDRFVAVKVLREEMYHEPSVRERFQREVRTIARLEHPYILPVYDFGEDRGVPYLVMRYTNNGSLDMLIRDGSLTFDRSAQLVEQAGEALAYAHRHNVVHRDVKPANVLIGPHGNALLMDFGIAKLLEGATRLTMTGMMVGTPNYMAPEQVQGLAVDGRADLYALGVVLYECLVGKRPFEADTPLAVVLKHLHDPVPPPRTINPALPEVWGRVLLKALDKDPEARFQTGDQMVVAVREARTAKAPLPAVSPAQVVLEGPSEAREPAPRRSPQNSTIRAAHSPVKEAPQSSSKPSSRSPKPPIRRQPRPSVVAPPATVPEPTPPPPSPSIKLTPNQRELLACLLGGRDDRQIADHLRILKSEVQRETRVLMTTVGVSSERDLKIWAIQQHIDPVARAAQPVRPEALTPRVVPVAPTPSVVPVVATPPVVPAAQPPLVSPVPSTPQTGSSRGIWVILCLLAALAIWYVYAQRAEDRGTESVTVSPIPSTASPSDSGSSEGTPGATRIGPYTPPAPRLGPWTPDVTHPLPIPGTAIDRVFLQPNAQCGSGNCTVVHAAVRVSGADAARATVIAFIWMASGDPLPAAATGPAASYNVNGQAAVSITYEVSSDLMVLKDVKLGIPSEVLLKGKGSFATIEIHDPAGKILAGPVKSDTF